MERRAFPLICVAAVLLITIGCAPKRPEYDALYARLVETPGVLDSSVLEGRRIVIDPGHGGCFGGVVGADSLREADANLGVALYLWGLLKEAGAEVELTRTTDRDFSDGDEENLGLDLENRTALANAFEPEVFISIHHNSILPLDREKNRIEIYYRSDDRETSAELAGDIHTHLARNLGIADTEIKPASYYVLRNSTARAAVLGEASYLSNPNVEEKLKLSTKQRLEGEAYFLGLVSYFSRGVPRIERLEPASDTLDAPGHLSFAVRPEAGVPIDPGTAEIRVGPSVYKPHFDGTRSSLRCALDPDLPNGSYEILCRVRSLKGGTAASKPFTLLVSRPARFILPLQPSTAPEGRVYLSVKALDGNGDPVANGTIARVWSIEGGGAFEGPCRNGVFGFETERTGLASEFIAELPGFTDTLRFDDFEGDEKMPLLVIDASTGEPIPSPLAVSRDLERNIRGNPRGLLFLPSEGVETAWLVSARGYRMKILPAGEKVGTVFLEPRYGVRLKELKIAVDPAGGGSDHQGVGKGKLRGAAVNMEIAKRIADILSGGGAAVKLTRRGEESISIEERIYKVNRFRPDLAVRIRLAEGEEDGTLACTVLHYPGSEKGMMLAGELARRLEGMPPCAGWRRGESAALFLQQTNCPAVEICNGSIARVENERIYSHPLHPQLEAERIAAAIIAYAGEQPIEQTVRILVNGEPIEGATVSIDQALTRLTDASGDARFACVLPGEHVLTIMIQGEALARLTPISVTDGSPITVSLEP
jgi:N-acetylmuramoyl-L-alanine amidase